MVLSIAEESLIEKIRALPPGEAEKFLHWAQQFADLARSRTVHWSDSWTDSDLHQASRAAFERFERQESEGH